VIDVLRLPYGSELRRFHFEQKVLDHGFVKYVAHMGSDESIVEAARMSTGKGFQGWDPHERCANCGIEKREGTICSTSGEEHPHDWKTVAGDEKLLEFLYANHHMTPFEMCELAVEVKAPIFVFRELHRHRTFSINEMSARYTQMPNEHYVPALDRFAPKQTGNKQADSASSASADYLVMGVEEIVECVGLEQGAIYDFYETQLKNGVPKEIARINTPVSRYSVMRWKANLRNWLQMFTLRDHHAAQWECQQTVKPIVEIARALFPRTIALWEEHTKYAVTLSRSEVEEMKELLRGGKRMPREEERGELLSEGFLGKFK
jgi:thymidylate synthase (FAD)